MFAIWANFTLIPALLLHRHLLINLLEYNGRSIVQKEMSSFIRQVLKYAAQSLASFYRGGHHG